MIPRGSSWSAAGVGRHQLRMAELAVRRGGHARVGLEDNVNLSRGVQAQGSAPLVALGESFYGWVAANREFMGRVTALLLPWKSFGLSQGILTHTVVAGLLVVLLVNNITRLPQVNLESPWTFQRIATGLALSQYWNMFAPDPGARTQWLFVEGDLEDGRKVDLYEQRFTPPKMEKVTYLNWPSTPPAPVPHRRSSRPRTSRRSSRTCA